METVLSDKSPRKVGGLVDSVDSANDRNMLRGQTAKSGEGFVSSSFFDTLSYLNNDHPNDHGNDCDTDKGKRKPWQYSVS